MTERRRDARFPRTLRFQVSSEHREGIEAESVNISSRGLYCVVNRFVPPFSKLNVLLDLSLPGGETGRISCEGVVVRVEPEAEIAGDGEYRLAVYFLNLNREEAAMVQKYLETEH